MPTENTPESHPRSTKAPSISIAVASVLLAAFWIPTLGDARARRDDRPRSFDARLRRLFETNAPGIRALAIPMNGLLYLFGERRGADTVFVARSSTRGRVLLFTPEMAFERGDPERDPVFVRNVDVVREKIARLREAGVARILLIPVPTKLSVELAADPTLRSQAREIPGEHPAEMPDGHRTADVYERLAASLVASESVGVVSLQRLFTSRAAGGADPVFSYEDSHWTSLGLALAAAETVRAWRSVEPPLVKTGRLADAPGDLQLMLALPDRPSFRTHPFDEDVYELRRQAAPEPCPSAVFLLGTSYSSHRGQTLAGELGQASGCPVTDLSVAGEGTVASFGPLFTAHRDRLRGATIIWEFPFRDLLDPRSFVPRP